MWRRFDEGFDGSAGGCLYVDDLDDKCRAAGAIWLDGGEDGKHYFAFVAEFAYGQERYGDAQVRSWEDAPDAFIDAIDSDVSEEVGWFSTLEEAEEAVRAHIGA